MKGGLCLDRKRLKDLIERYETVQMMGSMKVVALIKEQIGEDVTSDQHLTLRYIKKYGPCTSTELADVFFVNKSAITAIITRLVEKGYVQRTRDETDRRIVHLSLTEEGECVFQEAEEKIHQVVEPYLAQLDVEELEAFIKTYEKLANLFKGNPPQHR